MKKGKCHAIELIQKKANEINNAFLEQNENNVSVSELCLDTHRITITIPSEGFNILDFIEETMKTTKFKKITSKQYKHGTCLILISKKTPLQYTMFFELI